MDVSLQEPTPLSTWHRPSIVGDSDGLALGARVGLAVGDSVRLAQREPVAVADDRGAVLRR